MKEEEKVSSQKPAEEAIKPGLASKRSDISSKIAGSSAEAEHEVKKPKLDVEGQRPADEQRYFAWLKIPANKDRHCFDFLPRRFDPVACKPVDLFKPEQIVANKQKLEQLLEGKNFDEAKNVRSELLRKAPNDAPVLEFLYESDMRREDLLAAEGIVSRLLYLFPEEQKYLSFRKKLIDKVNEIDNQQLLEIDSMKEQFMNKQPEIEKKLIESRKMGFFERFARNTLAIEGGELTLQEIIDRIGKADDELRVDEPDEAKAYASNEAMAKLCDIYELDGLVELEKYLDERNYKKPADLAKLDCKELLQMHELQMRKILILTCCEHICAKFRDEDGEDVLMRKPYQPVYAADVEPEMHKFIQFLRNGTEMVERGELHAVELAALAHYFFVHVHPFGDGNGRISRKICNIVLQCFSYPPIIVQNRRKEEYMDAVVGAVVGDVRQFVRLIASYVAKSLRLFVGA